MANWIYVENGEIVSRQDILPQTWNNISNLHALSKEELKGLGWYPSVVTEPHGYDGLLWRIDYGNPKFTINADTVSEVYSLIAQEVPPTDPTPEEEYNNALNLLKRIDPDALGITDPDIRNALETIKDA